MGDVSIVSRDWLTLAVIVLAFFFGAAYGAGEASAQESWEAPNLHNWTLIIYDYGGPWKGNFGTSPGGDVEVISRNVVLINSSETVEAIICTNKTGDFNPQLISMMLIDNEDGAVVNTARGYDCACLVKRPGYFEGGTCDN